MPPKGNEARAAALAEMDALLHRLRTEPRLVELARAEQEPLDDAQRANLREIRRDWPSERAAGVAGEAASLATSRCEHAWRSAAPGRRLARLPRQLPRGAALAREEAECLADASGLSPYDALMDRFEPGMTGAEVDRVFRRPAGWLPGWFGAVREKQAGEVVLQPLGPFARPRSARSASR